MASVPQQQTLRETVRFEGAGLHSGNRVSMSFLPAPPNGGILFRRVDLDGRPEVEARVENVSDTTRSTTLSKGNIRIHTVEHVMATFAGYGIDPQPEKREPYKVAAPLELLVGESLMSVFPHDRLKVTCTSTDKHGRFTQFFSAEVSPETWERELAHARTFCFYEEIEFLIKNGLIRGGSLENAVVIRDDAVLTTEPLRYPEEFVRHKILDILGDISLLGRPLCGHIVAVRPSHTSNCELARLIQTQMRRPLEAIQAFTPPLVEKPPSEAETKALLESVMQGG